MLVLTRKQGERIIIGENIEVIVLQIHANRVKLGFEAPKEVPVQRAELHQKITTSNPTRHHPEHV